MKVCLYCGIRLHYPQKLYCSRKCHRLGVQRDWIERWLQGKETGVKSSNRTSSRIRVYLIKTRGEKCERCGWSEINPVTKHAPVELEHIDGCWDNNKIENLILLCPNCHSLTSTFRSLNIGRGRKFRRIGSAATAAVL